MSEHRPYGILKRKDRDSHFLAKRPPPPRPPPPPPPVTKASVTSAAGSKTKMITSSSDNSNNKLLAGYMAYEFLTKGTVLGREVDQVRRPEVSPANIPVTERVSAPVKESYNEITRLMMMSSGENNKGVCISGVVNPTQVAGWIKM